MSFDSTLQIPTVCGVPTLKSNVTKKAAIAFDSCNNRFYQYNPKTAAWSYLGSGGGVSQDLQSVTDIGATTTNTITAYNFINGGWSNSSLNNTYYGYSTLVDGGTYYPVYDTAEGYSFYIKTFKGLPFVSPSIHWTARDLEEVDISVDSLLFKLPYDRAKESISLQSQSTATSQFHRLFYPSTVYTTQPVDTLATLADVRASSSGGTVTSVGSGYGLTGGPITTSGTLVVDTAILSGKYALKNEVQNGRFGNDTATIVMAKVHNNSGTTLTNGKVVFLATSGTNSDAPSVRLANNKNDSTSANTFGFVSGSIANNDTGWVILSGKIEKLNTSAFSNGDVIYLDSISGQWTKTKPQAPYHMVYLGVVVKANAGNGSIFVKCQNGYELDEIHDVQINGKLNNQIIVYSDTSKVWKNRSIYSVVDTSNVIATKTNFANKVNISDTASMLTNYAKTSAVNLKVNISDTSTMLSKYLRKTDSATLSNRINLKVNISDTASMLTNYAKTSAVNLKVNISDTASMLTNYVKKDTSCFYLINDATTTNLTATNTNLTYAVNANETYRIMVAGTCKNSSTGGVKVAIAAPTGTNIRTVVSGGGATMGSAVTNQSLNSINTLSVSFSSGNNVEVQFRIEGVIVVGANSGSITLQYAAGTLGTATIFNGTVMQLIKVKGL